MVVPAIHIPSSSFDSSTAIWKIIDEHYASDNDVDSVLPQPGVPPFRKAK
ncbi:UNVERIFIED_CONTAM: hypothetical protein Slati_0099300 [Sesamum latifolium]|uniref:Uncharacterized protein n=1 Tax=Sesamum latifolium TaxID=2727402 RepID=A0AAW2Y8M2_9LAMI